MVSKFDIFHNNYVENAYLADVSVSDDEREEHKNRIDEICIDAGLDKFVQAGITTYFAEELNFNQAKALHNKLRAIGCQNDGLFDGKPIRGDIAEDIQRFRNSTRPPKDSGNRTR
jgi:hypothetical protein